jgi:hypothetical protein
MIHIRESKLLLCGSALPARWANPNLFRGHDSLLKRSWIQPEQLQIMQRTRGEGVLLRSLKFKSGEFTRQSYQNPDTACPAA